MRSKKVRRCLGVSVCGILLFMMSESIIDFFKVIPHDIFILNDIDNGSSCALPKHDPFDSSIMKYFYDIELPCDKYPDVVYLDSELQIQTNTSAVKEAGWRHLTCEREMIQRVNEENIAYVPLGSNASSTVYSDCSKISCMDESSSLVYQQMMFHVDSKRLLKTKVIKDEDPEIPSVLIFGIDSLSQLMAKRLLPNTLEYLQRSIGAYIFNGYTKVAENTFPNLISLLSGRKEISEAFYRDKYLDNIIPFIWKNFSDKGYVTMFAEEQPMSPSFNAVSKGFKNPPTDHYFMPCAMAMDNTKTLIHSPNYKYSSTFYKLLLLKQFMFCHGSKAKYEIHIDYLKSFLSSYKNKRKFSVTWIASLAHDEPNYLRLADDQFREFFKWSNINGHLKNTILIFVGDHGSNLNDIRNTVIGRVEERMPIFAIALPPHLKQKYPNLDVNLRLNKDRLTSHFDTYYTMVDILQGSFSVSHGKGQVGRSLFRPVPSDRSCQDAGIRREYCPCHKYVPVDVPIEKLKTFAQKIVEKINSKFNIVNMQCKQLSLNKIENSQKIMSHFVPVAQKKQFTWYSLWHVRSTHIESKQYRMLISTLPGSARFESSVTVHSNGKIEVWDQISRANRYGNQSHCVKEIELKPFCFCG
ncbi:uncharacterized protein LOC132561958 [Ylistrum balloti]|uniref:uncharacterized protein LOC132561958 n=1 Tax=Ylistrum balloti TaxID=509963 RepID=UPI0029057F6F|nr:uncharacterized protein LOC132561958 [Ylistrum balloti]